MIKNITLFAVIAFGIIELAGCSNVIEKTQNPTSEKQETFSETQNVNIAQEPTETVVAENGQLAVYTDFTQARYSELLGKKPFAIFFFASWCPDCTVLEKKIKQNIENLPKGTVILKANFDTESELKLKYGITIQSTIVVIDKQGNAMPTLFGPSFDELKTAITQSL